MSNYGCPGGLLGARKSPWLWAVWDEKPALTRPLWRFTQLLCCSQQLEHGIRTDVGFSRYLPDALASGSQPLHSLEQLVIVLSLRSPSDASLLSVRVPALPVRAR